MALGDIVIRRRGRLRTGVCAGIGWLIEYRRPPRAMLRYVNAFFETLFQP